MSYHSKLRAELKDIQALTNDPIGRARALGQTGSDEFVLGRAKQMLCAFAKNAETFADLAENEAAVNAARMMELKLSHLAPPSGTLEDEMREISGEGCIPTITLSPQGSWNVGIFAADQLIFSGRGNDTKAAVEMAKAKLNEWRGHAGSKVLRQP